LAPRKLAGGKTVGGKPTGGKPAQGVNRRPRRKPASKPSV